MKALWGAILGGIVLPGFVLAPVLAGELNAEFVRASDESFSRPHDLALSPDHRFLFVADVGNNAVKVLDPDTLMTVGAIGEGELDSPHDVAFDRKGRLLVADSGNDRIVIYRVDGAKGTRIAIFGKHQASPEGVAVSDDGGIYVTNAANHTVLLIKDGALLKTIGAYSSPPVRFARPHDIHIDSHGRVLVADPGNNRIRILDRNLKHAGTLGGPPYNFNQPKYLASDAQGRIYIADEYNNRILILDRDDRPVGQIGTGERGKGPNRFNQPEGVTVWRGRVWISDTYNDRVVQYRLTN